MKNIFILLSTLMAFSFNQKCFAEKKISSVESDKEVKKESKKEEEKPKVKICERCQ